MMKNISRHILSCAAVWLLSLAVLPVMAQNGESRLSGGLRLRNVTAGKAAGNFVVSMDMVFDSVQVASNRLRAFTPVVRGRGGEEIMLPSVVLTGRRQHYVYARGGVPGYPDAKELRRENGRPQAEHYVQTVPYEMWMRNATVAVLEDSCGCGVNLASRDNSVLRLREAPNPTCAYIVPERDSVKVRHLEGRAFLDFPVNRTEIYPDYRNNPRELAKIIETIDVVRNDSNATIRAIGIHGYASPEGSYSNNVRLSIGRAAALRDYVNQLYKFGDGVTFDVRNTPEDWAGLDSFVRHSNLDVREELLTLIRTQMDEDAKNEEIKRRWPETYKFILATWYPALRHSDYVVTYTVRQFTTPEAAKRIYLEKPEQLSLHEFFMVAGTYEPGSEAYYEVLETAARVNPDSETANLNAANAAIGRRELAKADAYLAKAGNTPEAVHARGVVALLRGDYATARRHLEAARDAGVKEAAANLEWIDDDM